MRRDQNRIFDEYLAAAARAGDRDAFGRLVVRWQPRLLRHAYRVLGDADQAGDMVQEAWIEIVRGLPRLDDAAAFPAWAYRIVTRRCRKAVGRMVRDRSGVDALAVQPKRQTPMRENGEFRAELRIVLEAVDQLPNDQRAALSLFHMEELSVAEIAVALHIPVGTVKTRLMHARRKVRQTLEGDN